MSPTLGDAELTAMLKQFGVDATVGAATAKVLVGKVGEEIQPGVANVLQATEIALTYKFGSFPALVPGVVVVIAGNQFSPTEFLKISGGTMTRAICERR
jgi:hypothetical protein